MIDDLSLLLVGGFVFLPIIGIGIIFLGVCFHLFQYAIKINLHAKLIVIAGLGILLIGIFCAIGAWIIDGPGVFVA